MKKQVFFISLLILVSINALAHGEDRPGPHGGYIRMPGNFHTEVIQEKTGFRIYLLDIHWKNPTVLDSSVSATLQIGRKKTELSCVKESKSFLCAFKSPTKGVLTVIAKREGQTGAVANYNLPLTLEAPKNEMLDHSMPGSNESGEHQGH